MRQWFWLTWVGFVCLGPIQALAAERFSVADAGVQCKLIEALPTGSRRTDCTVTSTGKALKTVHVLNLNGPFPYHAQDQGKLLANEAHEGVLTNVKAKFEAVLQGVPGAARSLVRRLAECLGNRVWDQSTPEFRNAMRGFYTGYTERLKGAKPFSFDDIKTGAVGIEQAIVAEGMMSRIHDGDVPKDLAACGINAAGRTALAGLGKVLRFFKFGCLGFAAPERRTAQVGSVLHARNFDTDMVESWVKHPTVFLVSGEGRYKYLSIAAAGMTYNGGISGMNEAGIAVSIHEMGTTKYKVDHDPNTAYIGPFLQQRILREAGSIDEAWDVVRKAGRFGSWTIFVSDAKTGEIASLEFTGQHQQLLRRSAGDAVVSQANHFIGSEMLDQFYEHSFNKTLESRSRFNVTKALLERDAGKIDVDWALDTLAFHWDEHEGFRSFGRTNVKAYTIASTVALAKKNQMWFTIGDAMPAAHGHYLGIEVDWKTMNYKWLGVKRVTTYDTKPGFKASLWQYVQAKEALTDGKTDYYRALLLLEDAIRLARQDGIEDYPYQFMRARVLFKMWESGFSWGKYKPLDFLERAYAAWTSNKGIVVGLTIPRQVIHPYTKALTFLYWVQARDALFWTKGASLTGIDWKAWKTVRERLVDSEAIQPLEGMRSRLGYRHQGLDGVIDYAKKLRKRNGGDLSQPDLDFVTIE